MAKAANVLILCFLAGWSLATQVKEQDEIDDWAQSEDLPKAPESKFYRYKRSEPTPTPESPTVKGAWRVRFRAFIPRFRRSPPPPINGGWGQFRNVGTCSTICGGGTQRQDRLCNNPAPQHGGSACYGSSYQYVNCNTQCCPLNGDWSGWKNGSCSTTCGKGVLERRRRCNNPRPSCGGASCPGPSTTNVECQLRLCPDCSAPVVADTVMLAQSQSGYTHLTRLTYSCQPGYEFEGGAQGVQETQCDAGNWTLTLNQCTDIDECSLDVHSCDPGTSSCVNTIGGFKCDCLPGYVKDGEECKLPVINGSWSEWQSVGPCSLTCGGGQQRHERRCNNPAPKNGGLPCSGSAYKFEDCNTQCCAVHGSWSEWNVGSCSKTCNIGMRVRTRTCTSPAPWCGGQECEGVDKVREECQYRPCDNCTMPSKEFFNQRTGMLMDEKRLKHEMPYKLTPSGEPMFDHGLKVPYSCLFGYQHSESKESTVATMDCDNGKWYRGTTCQDMDECSQEIYSCNSNTSTCKNTDGSYGCPCKEGYELFSERNCTDINECTQSPFPCDQLCRNDKGSHQCYCRDGYKYNGTTQQCESLHKGCPTLPDLPNGQVECKIDQISFRNECSLRCDADYKFLARPITNEECIDGKWHYQRKNEIFPKCQKIESPDWMESIFKLSTKKKCDIGSNISPSVNTEWKPGNTWEAKCSPFETEYNKRRAEGVIVVRVVIRTQLNDSCDDDCLRKTARENEQEILSVVASPEFSVEIQTANNTYVVTINVTANDTLVHEETLVECGPGQALINSVCGICLPGYTYNKTAQFCDPCEHGTFKSSSGLEGCTLCEEGLHTRVRGASRCEAKCLPGSHSEDGFSLCNACPKGTFQNEEGADFCYQCDYAWTTQFEGATSSSQCGCLRGTFGQNCSQTCSCTNGGRCTSDGCECPRGWTGMNCEHPEECQGLYMVTFAENYIQSDKRDIHVLSKTTSVDMIAEITKDGETQVPIYKSINSYGYTTLQIGPSSGDVIKLVLKPDISAEVIGVNREYSSMDAFAAIPIPQDDKQNIYFVISTTAPKRFAQQLHGFVELVAYRDDTRIAITLAADGTIEYLDYRQRLMANLPYSTTLNKREKIVVKSPDDLTGTKIVSSFGIAVYSGHKCAFIPIDSLHSGCDHLVEQIPPTSMWGTEYIVTSFIGSEIKSVVKIVPEKDATTIDIQCMSGGLQESGISQTLNAGEQFQFTIRFATTCRITATDRVLVAQLSTGYLHASSDISAPALVIIPDVTKTIGNTSFISINNKLANNRHYINFVIMHNDKFAMSIDGKPINIGGSFQEMATFGSGDQYRVIRMPVEEGYHHLQHNSLGNVFGLVVYGFSRDDGYAYSLGYNQGC